MSVEPAHPTASGVTPLVGLYLDTLTSSSSRRSMRASLDTAARVAAEQHGIDLRSTVPDWSQLDWAAASRLRSAMVHRWAPATVNRHLAALRGVVKVAMLTGAMDSDQAARCREALRSVKSDHHDVDPRDRLVSEAELRMMFLAMAMDSDVIARRDAALFAVLAMGGLRRSEVVSLDLADWDPQAGELLVRHGKGGKVRKVWLHTGAATAVADWLAVRGDAPGPLLLRVRRGGHVVAGEPGRITDHAVWLRTRHWASQASIKAFAPHDLRRKMITDLLDHGDDLSAVQRLAGHATITTTARYDRRGERAARKAADHLVVPYVSPVKPRVVAD